MKAGGRLRTRDAAAALLVCASFLTLSQCAKKRPAPKPGTIGITPWYYTPPPAPKAPTPRPGHPTRTPTIS